MADSVSKKVLVLAEHAGGAIDDATWELLTAARSLAGEGGHVAVALLGHDVGAQAAGLAKAFGVVHVFDDPRLAEPNGEMRAELLAELQGREGFDLVLLAHTNPGIDTAPGLSVRMDAPLLTDCLELGWDGDGLSSVRTMYAGKVHARVRAVASPGGTVATLRGGAYAATEPGDGAGELRAESVGADVGQRRRTVRTVEIDAGEVDISQAEVLVGVGRGIEDEENLELVQTLAESLGGEVACSRPVVDKGWLPKSRQVGTSGVTVKPRLYVAVGISGSFQHIGGIKGSPYLVAINKDPKAPIFGVADVGIVGDLFDIVPVLEERLREAKG